MRIANCSGFYGDRLSAPADLLAGPDPFDVLTGDYLAELTMLLLWKARQRDPSAGYARTFLTQMGQVLDQCVARGIRVVSNAGGLNPHGLAAQLGRLGGERAPRLAVVDGDDLTDRVGELQAAGEPLVNLETGRRLDEQDARPVTAHAYLGAWGIADALASGADVVVCGRVTDAALALGPAAWWHGWSTGDWDRLAGGVVAGHIIECGTQATGGNYPFAGELTAGYPGFPIAEVAEDGSCVVTKQPGTGGAVTVGTVTAQLLYEIEGAAYLNPDVVARFDTLRLTRVGPDRVAVDGARGAPPPDRLKVGINLLGGYRNSMTLLVTGLDIEGKAARAESLLFELLGGRVRFDAVDVALLRTDRRDADTNAGATAELRITVKGRDQALVGRRFPAAVTELALASFAGFYTRTPPGRESAFGVYWPTLVDAGMVRHTITAPDGTRHDARRPGDATAPAPLRRRAGAAPSGGRSPGPSGAATGPTSAVPLGALCGARSGDKGGNANVGVWTWDAGAFDWLRSYLSVPRLQRLLPETARLEVRRVELANLWALNFVVVGLLGEGVASSVRSDPQAKSLGEWLRSRTVEVPTSLLHLRRDGTGTAATGGATA